MKSDDSMRVLVGNRKNVTVLINVSGRDCLDQLAQLFACLGPDSDLKIISYEIRGQRSRPPSWFGKLTFVRNVAKEESKS